jgi:anti-sigma factor RsiW
MMGTMGQPWNEDGIDQHVLDLLVDGELSDEQERAVIARLDNTPDAWRRCALTFLEDRCWQRAAETVTQPCEHTPHATRQAAAPWRAQPWTCALLMAATFLLAFGVGNFLPRGGD